MCEDSGFAYFKIDWPYTSEFFCSELYNISTYRDDSNKNISTQKPLNDLVSILQALTSQTVLESKPLDYQKDEKISLEDAFIILNLLSN